MKKILLYIMIVVLFVLATYSVHLTIGATLINGGLFNAPIGKEKMENIFDKDRELLVTVSNYLANSDYQNIYIPNTMESGMMSNAGVSVSIEDGKVISAIQTLNNRGYQVITKDSNTISFQRWSNLDNGRGIACSIDGSKPTLQFLTKLEPLSMSNWYYYEEDFNEWKSRNITNGIPNYIIGVWDIQSAKVHSTGESYSLQDLYGTGISYGGKLVFNDNGTFSRYIGITTGESDNYEGTYQLSYNDSITLTYNNGTTSTAKYLSSSQEMVYYTWDANGTRIDEYYIKSQ